jgi:four helix bundle protein
MNAAPAIRSYRDLVVWQRAMDLMVEAYRLAARFPPIERYGLAAQIRRASVSVPANIAEGHGRAQRGEYRYHLSVAHGSLMELETEIIAATRLGYVSEQEASAFAALAGEVGRLLNGLSRALRNPRRGLPGPRPPTPDP